MLKINNLYKSFDETNVLKEIDLEIKESSIFGLVGINGSGKSTLLRCVAGIYMADKGNISLDDKDTYKDVMIRKEIMYVSDDSYFESGSTINKVKKYYESFYNFDEVAYYKYLNLFGLDEDRQISSFSKGMKRQVSLIFALSIKPKLLLLDESFDGLDPLVRLKVKKALIELIEDNKTTVIISSHNLRELEDICDSYGILNNGKILTSGDLVDSKEDIIKYQLAYKNQISKDDFKDLSILSYKKEGEVITMVVKGNNNFTKEIINKTNPVIINELPVSFEEMFIYEVESRGLLNE